MTTINTTVAAATEQATRTELYQDFIQSVPRAKAEDGTYRGARHGAFTSAVTIAADAVAKLQPGFYPVRSFSANVGVQGWALRVAAKRAAANGARIEVISGGKGNATVLHVL